MDKETARSLSDLRSSLGYFSGTSQNNESETEMDDPISAYFKQRCGDYSKTYFKKYVDSDSDSSLGLIDVDNVSLFGEGENEVNNIKFSDIVRDSISEKNNKKNPDGRKSTIDSQLDKQRALAQKALQKINLKTNEEPVKTPETKRTSKALSDISGKLYNAKLSVGGDVNSWFRPNCSPNTPRLFNDELSSYTDCGDIPEKDKSSVNKRESEYNKKVSSIMKEISEMNLNPDVEFESQTEEEQIHRFEEDEIKFKLENSGLPHNSEISTFSEMGETSQWPLDSSNAKMGEGDKKLSIGQFFNMRSNRVSSLLGSKAKDTSDTKDRISPKSECNLSTDKTLLPEKLKPRRYGSTCELSRNSEAAKSNRYSVDSCASNSTLMIQNLISEMDSGLSGSEIYEKLLKTYGKEKKDSKNVKKTKPMGENSETPKSSKLPKRKEMVKEFKKPTGLVKDSKGRFSLKELKENEPVRDSELNDSIPFMRAKGKLSRGRSFDASTPKLRPTKSQNDRLKNACSKIIMEAEDWEAPRVSAIQPMVDLNRSEMSDENDKTILVNSTISSSENKKCNATIVTNETVTIEDTILAGDLTVLSQKIEELNKDDDKHLKTSKEQALLTVVQKLADLPKGSVDCSALTPLLRDQFPDLLSTFLTNSMLSSTNTMTPAGDKAQESLLSVPGSWIELPAVVGAKEKIFACADLEKTIFVPFANTSQNWLLISIEHLEILSSQGSKLQGKKINNSWTVMDFMDISMKDTVVPPESRQSLKIFVTSRVVTKFEIMITFTIKEMISKDFQSRNMRVLVNSVNPENYINVIPKDSINFGVIADECFDQRDVQVTFDGICELPLTVYLEETEVVSQHFILSPQNATTGNTEKESNDNIFHHVFHEGEKQVLEFKLIFQPNVLLQEDDKPQYFKAVMVLMLGGKGQSDGILRKIPIKGGVAHAKFLCNPSCNPLVFRAPRKGEPVTKTFPLKNVGSIALAFSVRIVNSESKVEETDDLFTAPNSFYMLPKEESEIKIIFNANTSENCIKRRMYLQIKPNGRAKYDVELIGLVSSNEKEVVPRPSSVSSSTRSIANSDAEPVKLLTSCHSLSWPAVGLEKELRQTVQIKTSASAPASVRISFKKNSDSFKLINEHGEKVTKLRKIFKPDVPQTLTVIFRPDLIGPHINSLVLETSHSDKKKMIALNGIGGMPQIFVNNIQSDLNGSKLLRLKPSPNSSEWKNTINFKNEGKIPGFVLLLPNSEVFCLCNELSIYPSSFVVAPNSTVSVVVSQKLKNADLRQLLADKDICKLATVSLIMGDEPSRLRFRKLTSTMKGKMSERVETLTAVYQNEQQINVKAFQDSLTFEKEFVKSLQQIEVAVVVETSVGLCEPTIVEEDSFYEFNTILSVCDNTVIPSSKHSQSSRANTERPPSEVDPLQSLLNTSSHEKITKWFETLECN